MKKLKTDILICGCGIVGITIARELASRGHSDITIIEKEEEVGLHASGRNSGVLHAGIYYSPDSLKAKSCLNGNRLLKKYCKKKGIPLLETGKVIVTKCESEIETLHELYNRALNNGTEVKLIDEKELAEIEPFAKTVGSALYSPETAMMDPKIILQSLYDECTASKKITILKNTEFKKIKGSTSALTNNGEIIFNTFINSAGAYSDKIAHSFGIGTEYKLVPFKGTYRRLNSNKSHMVKGNIYPVPNIKNTFLGVHFTRSVSNEIYIGPTAIPAFGRENYGILKGINFEGFDILFKDMIMFFANPKFRRLALTEPQKYLNRYLYKDAKMLLKDFEQNDIIPSTKSGIRPQLINWKTKELVLDFLVIKDANSIHVLNAISPAFTSSMDFAKKIVDNYI